MLVTPGALRALATSPQVPVALHALTQLTRLSYSRGFPSGHGWEGDLLAATSALSALRTLHLACVPDRGGARMLECCPWLKFGADSRSMARAAHVAGRLAQTSADSHETRLLTVIFCRTVLLRCVLSSTC